MTDFDKGFDQFFSGSSATGAPGSTPPAPSFDAGFDSYFKAQAEEEGKLRASVFTANQTSPDKAAAQQRLSAVTGLPLAVVQTNEGEAQARVKFQEISKLAQSSPVLRARLVDPNFTVLVQDDTPALEALGNALVSTTKYLVSAPDQKNTLMGDMGAGVAQANRGAAGVGQLAAEFAAPLLDPLENVQAIGGNPLRRLAEGFALSGASSNALAKSLSPPTSSTVAGGVSSGVQSFVGNALMLPLALMPGGAQAALLGMSSQQGGQSYQDAREKGINQSQAAIFAASQAAVEYATEKLPMHALVGDVKTGAPVLRSLLKQIGLEVPGEQIATALQDLNEWSTLTPEKPFSDYLAERPAAALQTLIATAIGVGGNVALVHGIQRMADTASGIDRQQDYATRATEHLQQLMALSAQSKLRERNPGTFAEVTQQMAQEGGAPTEVRFDARTLGEVLNQEELAQLPSVASQMAEALATGGEVVVPIGELMAQVAGTPLEQKLTEHARVGDAELSAFEAKEAKTQAETYLQEQATRIIAQANDNGATQNSADAVKQALTEQLTNLGRFTADVNGAYATVATNMYVALASRLGITPEQAYAKYGMTINGVNPATQGDVLSSAARPNGLTLEGYHYSTAPRPVISTHAYGSNYAGSGKDTYKNATDKRLRNRAYFYVDTGNGITPEAGVGGIGHRASLSNVYDANSDPLRLRKGGQLAFESAVLDRGFDGYLDRLGGTQAGQVVLLGDKAVNAEVLGPLGSTTGAVAPAPAKRESRGRDTVVDALNDNKSLPMGAATLKRWSEILDATMPTAHKAMADAGMFSGDGGETLYKSELIARFEQATPAEDYATQGESYAQGTGIGWDSPGGLAPLPGAPKVEGASGPDPRLVSVAEQYAASIGVDLKRQADYVKVDPVRAAAIAQEYEAMAHAPQDPAVKAAYADLIDQTVAQYRALEASGYQFYFFDESNDPYQGNPWNAMRDLRANQRMGVFATEAGFGSGDTALNVDDNPLLADTGIQWAYSSERGTTVKRVLANDLFRAVHDAFGHGLEGAGFRAEGEENAWQAHVRMFTGAAVGAITTETRGQNSWLNYGPHGEANRNAKVEDTVFADQKTGLMSPWTWEEGRAGDAPDTTAAKAPTYSIRQTPVGFEALDANGKTIGRLESNITPEQSRQLNEPASVDIVKVNDERKGQGVGRALYSAWAAAHDGRIAPSGKTSPDAWKLWKRNYPDKVEEFIMQEAGRIAGGAPAEQVLANVTDTEVKQAIVDASGYAQAVTPTKYQSKYLAGRDVSALTPEERAQYNALGASPVLNQPKGSTARGTFNPKTLTISLLEQADLSTFHHEMGHFYLEVLVDAASQPAAPASIVGDVETLFKWFGVKDLDTWNKMTLSEKRASHEKFAEGYEAYLFEGKSPNLEMQTMFQRFASWMKNVYKSLSDFMATHGTQLTDEVRGVYDRMLATEAQIEQAEAARNYAPLFKSAEQAGMTPEAWAMYQLHGQEATEDAITELQARSLRDMRWTANARSRALKELTKDAAEKRKGAETEVRGEVAAMPVYAAWNTLRSKEGPKLETLALEELYGTGVRGPDYDRYGLLDWRRLVDQKMTAKDGVHPDVVAEQFGFSSGDELVRKMLDAEPQAAVIDAMTDQRMLERYGDLSTPAALEMAANKAVHNEARAKFVATELAAISKANKPTNILLKAAKQFAEGLVAQRKVRDLKPGQHTAAETRASKNAEKAMAVGDTQAAILAKRDQLLQFYAAKFTVEAQTEVDKKVDALKKIATNDKLPIEYRDQIDKLLERVDLKNRTLRDLDKRAKLADWLKAQEEIGVEPDIPDYLREDSQLTSYKDMSVEEFRGLYDTIKQIEHLGRLKNKLLTSKDKRDFEAIRNDIANSIDTLAGDRKANPRTATTKGGRWLQAVKDFGSAHIKAATWARVMDGGKDGGKVWEYFVRAANEQGSWETKQRSDATEKLTAILEPWLKKGNLSKQTFFPAINRSLTRQEVFAMALNSGNESNLQRLMGGEGWTLMQVESVLASLDKTDWAVAQKVWDHMESYWPEIEAKNLRVYGKRLDKVPTGSSVTEALGLRGGYYPVKYDPRASIRASEHADAESAQRQLKGAFNAATTRRSFTKARVDEVVGRPLLYNLSGLYSGVNDVIHDLAWHEWLIDTNRLLKSTVIDTAIRSHYGDAAARQLKTWRDAIAEGDTGSQEALDSALGYLRQSVSVAGLGFNVVSAAMQPIGITNSISRVGAKWIGKGVAAYVAAPIAQTKEAQEKSAFMANRARTQFRDLNELRNRVQGEDTLVNSVRKNAYFLMMQAQRMVDVPTWHGAYEKAISEGNDELRAVSLADQAVVDSQGGGETKDLAAIERGGPAQKLFTAFYSFMNTVANLGYGSARTKTTMAKAMDILLLGVLPAMLPVLLKDALTPGSAGDDDWKKLVRKLLGEQLAYMLGMFVVSREFAEAGKTLTGTTDHPRDYAGPAGVRMVADAGTFAKQAYQMELDDAFRKAAINLMGDVVGLPSAQLNRTITGTKALKEGKTNNPMAILMGYQEPK